MESLPTIDEYLQLADWTFTPDVEEGQHEGYFWYRSNQFVFDNIFDHISVPITPFQILVTSWDEDYKVKSIYKKKDGWRRLGEHVISSASLIPPKLTHFEYLSYLILDKEYSDEDLQLFLDCFGEVYALEVIEDEEVKLFWDLFAALDPFLYFSFGLTKHFSVISRGEIFHQKLVDSVDWIKIESIYKKRAMDAAAKKWEDLGPERGPEKCVVNGCERLRIPLAIRCFIHQLRD